MSKMVVATFQDYLDAQRAARAIKEKGLRTDDISIVTKDSSSSNETKASFTNSNSNSGSTATMSVKNDNSARNDNISDGVVTGGILGGVAGLLLGAGSMIIPGIGAIAAAGPITGLLSGAVTGGIVGGLVDMGIPEEEGKAYEEQLKQGKVLFSMKAEDQNITSITSILKNNSALSVDTY
jgi:uncharacterized membrane protein